MRVVIWIVEGSWQVLIDRARELIPADAEVTLLHVAAADVEQLAAHPGPGRLGRRHRPPGRPVREVSDAEAQALLEAARERLGRHADTNALRGRVEHVVVAACASREAELLLLARDGEDSPGPHSLGRQARFVVDHAGCDVILVWQDPPRPNPGPAGSAPA